MLIIGLIDELSKQLKSEPESSILSYFFCQGTEDRLKSAVSVLRGLIYLLASQKKNLIRHIRKRYDVSGRPIFEDGNALYALSTIFLLVIRSQWQFYQALVVNLTMLCIRSISADSLRHGHAPSFLILSLCYLETQSNPRLILPCKFLMINSVVSSACSRVMSPEIAIQLRHISENFRFQKSAPFS